MPRDQEPSLFDLDQMDDREPDENDSDDGGQSSPH